MEKIKFVIIGFGNIGKRHAEIIAQNQQAELVAIVDVEAIENIATLYPKVSIYCSLESFLQSKTACHVANICTPNGLHLVQAISCMQHGMHVVIEKPLTLGVKDAEILIAEAKAAKKNIFPVMQNRYSPPVIWLKQLITNNIIGNIYQLQLNCFWNRDNRYYMPGSWHGTANMDGGTLFTQFSHFIDLLFWIFGDIDKIQSKLQNFNHTHSTAFEDSGIITFNRVKGGMGVLSFSTAVYNQNFESSITVIAENGSLKIGGQYMNTLEYCHIKNYNQPVLPPTQASNDYGMYKGSAQNHAYIIENVLDVLLRKGTQHILPEEGLKVVEIIERMYDAALQKP